MNVRVYASGFCNLEHINEDGIMRLPDGATLNDVYKKLRIPFLLNYLYNNIPADADPLGPDNILGFTSGLLTDTGSLVTGRWMAVCKSPLTGGWGDANCGGDFAPRSSDVVTTPSSSRGSRPRRYSCMWTSRVRSCGTPRISGATDAIEDREHPSERSAR